MAEIKLPSGITIQVRKNDFNKDNLKELQGQDYEKLGLSRGILATMTGDDEKMAKSIVKNAKGRNVSYYKNKKGEIVLQEDGKNLGVINKDGISKQDGWNIVRDPSNFAMAIPGVGAVLKGASLAAKAVRALKLGGAVAGVDMATTTSADLANGEGVDNLEKNVTRAVTTGALAPVADVIGSKIATKIGNKLATKKVKLKEGDVPLTRGQATGNKADLSYETDVSKGVYGEKSQEILDKYKNNQMNAYKKSVSNDLPVKFDDNSRNLDLGDELQGNLRILKDTEENLVEELYNRVNKDGVAIDVDNAKSLVDSLENALEPGARRNFEKHGVEAPEAKSINFIDSLKEDLARTNKPMSLRELESSRRTLNSNINKAVAKQDNEAVKDLMAVKTALDDGVANLAIDGKLLGDKRELLKLLDARKAEADFAKKFINTKTSLNDKVKDQVTSYGAKDVINFIKSESKGGDDLAKVFAGNNEARKLEVINKVREITGKGGDNVLRELYLNNIFSDISRVGREANINPNEAIKKITERVEKSDKVAKQLFSPQEISRIKEGKELLQKINTYYDVNPSGTASKDIRKGILNSFINKVPVPVAGEVLKGVQNNIINPIQLKRYLNTKTLNQSRFDNNSLVATLGRALGIISVNQDKNSN